MNRVRSSIASFGLAFILAACSSSPSGGNGGDENNESGGNDNGGSAGSGKVGSTGSAKGGSGGKSGGSGGSNNSSGGGAAGDSTGNDSGGSDGSGGSGTAGSGKGGSGTTGKGGGAPKGTGGSAGTPGGGSGGGKTDGAGGGKVDPGSDAGTQGTGGSTGTGGAPPVDNALVTSSNNTWSTAEWTEVTSGTATVTVDDTKTAQNWEGMGAAFNELGWKYLSSEAMQKQAIKLLFSSTEGANFAWGRIPMGASDYAESRFTYDDTGDDVAPNGDESNRPAADTSLSKFSLERDKQKLIPYIKAAQAEKSDLRFWASPWTPPVWMKTGYKKDSGAKEGGNAKKPSYFDGGNMKSDDAILTAYAQYYVKFVEGYKEQGIKVEIVSPQNEPGYDQNYPSCLWDGATFTKFIGKFLGPAMKDLDVKVMLGTLSNDQKDITTAQSATADATAMSFLAVAGVQWTVLDKVVSNGQTFSGLPIWASEHKCGNYPWDSSYNATQAPNDQAYGEESWGYIKKAVAQGKVTSYNAWNMVLDKTGLGNDTSRDWRQDALLVADGGQVKTTPAYFVFRHISQFVNPGAKVIGTTGGDALAFKNPDGSLVAVMFNSGSAGNFTVAIGGKKLQFAMPGKGWATLKYKP